MTRRQVKQVLTFQVEQREGKFRHRVIGAARNRPGKWSEWAEMYDDCCAIVDDAKPHDYRLEYLGEWPAHENPHTTTEATA